MTLYNGCMIGLDLSISTIMKGSGIIENCILE